MKSFTYKSIASGAMVALFPFMVGCSVFSGNSSVSNDPVVAAQQREIQELKRQVEEAERYTDEAEEREKAAKDRLKAAEHELKALESRAERQSNY
ncbi:hypothetical protein ACFSKU_05455 [Pontibacter silvestris]|uniref:Uncharacterized protein n=1 Tax=Pontibacter silvestris TaxID=2305183 RepID=A0ABW4WUL4_9BACT|nr:hypothetical protein [Pontibacter silvestris]MCC9136983.1 hypothetical protein [Pontibacter silvestris]